MGTLQWSDNFNWCFCQTDPKGKHITEHPLPDLETIWPHYLSEGTLEIGWERASPFQSAADPIDSPLDNPPAIDPASFDPAIHTKLPDLKDKDGVTILRSGRIIPKANARHVSAIGLTKKCPTFLWQALRDKKCPDYATWLASYSEEHSGLESQNTYTVIDEAEVKRLGVKPIPSMNILSVKKDEAGKPQRAKSRTVVLGNEEETYWEKNDLFAPVIAKQSSRMLVAHAVSMGRRVKQCEAKNAFVHSTLPDDEVCVVIPPKGCPYSKPGTYWKLNKTLYGLRRSPRYWYLTFKKALEDIGLKMCTHEPCAFTG